MCEGGLTDWYEQKLLTTRAPHRCIECGELVPKNNQMFRVECLFEGRWQRHYTCLICEGIKEHMCRVDPDADICHGDLAEILLHQHFANNWHIYSTSEPDKNLPHLDVMEGRYLKRHIIDSFLGYCGLVLEDSNTKLVCKPDENETLLVADTNETLLVVDTPVQLIVAT